jgi:hypothetical protein
MGMKKGMRKMEQGRGIGSVFELLLMFHIPDDFFIFLCPDL